MSKEKHKNKVIEYEKCVSIIELIINAKSKEKAYVIDKLIEIYNLLNQNQNEKALKMLKDLIEFLDS